MTAYRAFLSHASSDADLVRAVGRELGRPFVKIDYQVFGTGVELLHGITSAVESSALFVLFASQASLDSLWVGHEVREAHYATAFGRMPSPVVYLVDKRVRVSDLPDWMQRAKVTEARSPRAIARDLRSVIDDVVRERQQDVYVGRSRERGELEELLAPMDGSQPPRVFGVTGLTGIGRRTLVERTCRDLLGFKRYIDVEVESADSIKDIASKVADLVEPVGSVQQSLNIFTEIQRGTDEDAVARTCDNLKSAIAMGELPILIDAGGLLQNDGRLSPPVRRLVDAGWSTPDVYVALVANRTPVVAGEAQRHVPVIQVRPLSDNDMRRLVSTLARKFDLEMAPRQVADLAAQCRGYPPAARYALELVRTYGAPALLADTERLVEFRTSPLLRYLREVAKKPTHQAVLRILAANSPLPLEVLAGVSGVGVSGFGALLTELIDLALVVPDPSGWYRISAPVIEAAIREYRDPPPAVFNDVARLLARFLADAGSGVRYVELERVRYRALAMAGTFRAGEQAVKMVSDWLRVAERLYHQREYDRCVEFASAVVGARPDNGDGHRWLISGYIKLGEYGEAREAIDTLRNQGMRREAQYLEGFLERHRGRLRRAAELYEEASANGYGGVSLHRELAHCYLELGMLDEARWHIDRAQARSRGNPYIIDLLIRIACRQKDEASATALLAVLAEVDDPHFVAHRRSRVAAQFLRFEEAYAFAREATPESGYRPSPEALCNLAYCCIRTGRHSEAEKALQRVERLYPKRQLDVLNGLRTRLSIVQGRYEEALAIWERLDDKTKAVHLRLKRDALVGMLRDRSLSDEVAVPIAADIEALERRMANVEDAALDELGTA